MRYREFKLTETELAEVKMSPGRLARFADSAEAQGIRAGFEAELIFPGLAGSSEAESEPDHDRDTRCHSIDEIIDFFGDDDSGMGLSPRSQERLRERLEEGYWERLDAALDYDFNHGPGLDLVRKKREADFDWDEVIRDILSADGGSAADIDDILSVGNQAPEFRSTAERQTYADEHPGYARFLQARSLARERLRELVEQSWNDEDGYYDAAREEFRDEYADENDERGYFSDQGWRYMSDIAEEFNLGWPYWTHSDESDGEFNESAAEDLAVSLSASIDMDVRAGSGYHSISRRDDRWIIEADSSLSPDEPEDMPAEIVSPPMPLQQCLAKMEDFFTWAEDRGAYTNRSTGFHMGVSLPETGGDVDYVKLALFLGDEYVLREFGRSSNTYCEAAMQKIRDQLGKDPAAAARAMDQMRANMLQLARKALPISDQGFGKYTSINPKMAEDAEHKPSAKYIEFRSAGGRNYQADVQKLKTTLLRYARAMRIAADPEAERQEYQKKLYKLIAPSGDNAALDLFARYQAGQITALELKQRWADAVLSKNSSNTPDQNQPEPPPAPSTEKPDRRKALAQRISGRSPALDWIGVTPPGMLPSDAAGGWYISYYDRHAQRLRELYRFQAPDAQTAVAIKRRYCQATGLSPQDVQLQQLDTTPSGQPRHHWAIYNSGDPQARTVIDMPNATAEEVRERIRQEEAGGEIQPGVLRARLVQEAVDEGLGNAIATGAMAASLALGGNAAAKEPPKAQHHSQPAVTAPAPHKQQLAPAPKVDQQTAYATLYRYAVSTGMTNLHELSQFIAQCAAETGNFRHLGEIGNAAQRAHDYNHTLGNTSRSDALNYVGRGYIQLTGKQNYQEAGQALHGDPNYYLGSRAVLAAYPAEAAKIAVWFWQKNVAPRVKSFTDTDAVTRAINGQHAHKTELLKRQNMFLTFLDNFQNFQARNKKS